MLQKPSGPQTQGSLPLPRSLSLDWYRFLISRMLTVTKVPHHKAIKIALAVKKHLVDNDRLDITQVQSVKAWFFLCLQ